MARSVPFQKWRIFFWALQQTYKSGRCQKDQPELAEVYRALAVFGRAALIACDKGQQDDMIKEIDMLSPENSNLERMPNGNGRDVPKWLHEDK